MEQLIPINQSEGGPVVSARLLHGFLESRQDFTTWAKARLEKYDFQEGVDFSIILGRSEANRQTTDYALTLDTAKELAMVENNEKGRQARRYFIECERQARNAPALPSSPSELILMLAQQNVANEGRILALEGQVAELAAHIVTSDSDYFSIMGYATLQKVALPGVLAQHYGRRAAELSRLRGVAVGAVSDARYGKVGTYHRSILDVVFNGKEIG
ncbi:antA/AntB antirepressor family protein [Hymenobacter fodinae]|uniref:Phage antirepressor protein n=1 Tax=Hymenobacter fodinae TaxID=2510796 RepID=A0A4Z0P719_9BACT|nr:antA/AntB antirepressor family protein [Hymenobacter fodinae]TGE07715.1 phage antirepressor protein [Hymenobacter fodinae]